ncbi:WD40-repeat-containing domain protein [Polychytrium aggregatum]|uniref:WD40-repeat-containing domain protein n=1 Tax=Polychytrium aggregatum TaxID=110093 RepID=UPI0022FE7059|nr:WD40-repeat-containing domain protein [Polychytrium aggregatum]KAI9190771.1 WD40-repeat-containing domain protein [Polychytrium aggregatum]
MDKKFIHFGQIDPTQQLAQLEEKGINLDELLADNPKDIKSSSANYELSASAIKAQQEQQAILDEFNKKRLARSLAVPTDDGRVRQRLIDLDEPQTLFGEGPAERRERLRDLLAQRLHDQSMDIDQVGTDDESDEDEDDDDEGEEVEEFFTYGIPELMECRKSIAHYSIPRAKERLAVQRSELELPIAQRKKYRGEWYAHLKTFATFTSQLGDDRPLSYCVFSPNSRILATGSWSGVIKLWGIPSCEHTMTLKGHRERISGIAFHPGATFSQSRSELNVVSGATDGTVNLWSLDRETAIAKLEGHKMRVARVAIHPSGRYIATSSFDRTWRLWDSETQKELLLQEGHSREVFGIGFQCDGALIATGGMDSIGRVWDLRTGRSIMTLQGHIKSILSLDWSPNGYQIATGSEDNSIRIWDVRAAKSSYNIPAHQNIVTQVRYWNGTSNRYPDWEFGGPTEGEMDTSGDVDDGTSWIEEQRFRIVNGSFLVSSSYDGTCKIWTEGDWKPIKALAGLEGKVMNCDMSPDGQFLATASYDRTFKLYASESIAV